MMQEIEAFERNVFDSLKKLLGRETLERTKVLGAAVSGGADSVSLLCALAALSRAAGESGADGGKKAPFPKVLCVTVDHSIRPESESAGDAAFVQALCQKLGVECHVKKLPRGLVLQSAAERGNGTEEAARFLRYQEFEAFARESGAAFICLAHNQNDALETLLMRFLQGSPLSGMRGMAARREIFLRPLMETSRADIEAYLRKKNIEWRTDATNADDNYLRNKIRNRLVPFLDENFCGWKKALLSGGEKAALEDQALDGFLDQALKAGGFDGGANGPDGKDAPLLEFSAGLFSSMPVALRQRLLYRSFDRLGAKTRVPYSFAREISFWPEKDFKNIRAAGLEAWSKKDKVFLKIQEKEATESGFFDIIYDESFSSEPFVLRSRAAGDKVEL